MAERSRRSNLQRQRTQSQRKNPTLLEDWGKRIGDVPAATAILDRFLQDAEIIEITGKSDRLRLRGAGEPASAAVKSKTSQTRTPGQPTTTTTSPNT